jgi:hypothetical protein
LIGAPPATGALDAAAVGPLEPAAAGVFFELEHPAAASAATTVNARIRFVAAIGLPSLLATVFR